MAEAINIWMEKSSDGRKAIRIDWDNDRHQRVEINGDGYEPLVVALERCAHLVRVEGFSNKV